MSGGVSGGVSGAVSGAVSGGVTALPGLADTSLPAAEWTGAFAEREVGIRVLTDARRSLVPVELLVGVALRQNPRRAQLLVSNVLAKHVPTAPGLAIVSAELLGLLVAAELGAPRPPAALFDRLTRILRQGAVDEAAPLTRGVADADADATFAGAEDTGFPRDATAQDTGAAGTRAELGSLRADVAELRVRHPEVVTIGYAETATALGQLVAETVGSYYIHSTRHAPDGPAPFAGFEEEHSHATSHQLHPTRRDWLRPGGTVVLVDDELSTGTTIVNTIRALQAAVPQARWIVASLIDLRSEADRARFDDLAATLRASISVVALGSGSIVLPPDVLGRAQRTLEAHHAHHAHHAHQNAPAFAPAASRAPRGPELQSSAFEAAYRVLSVPAAAAAATGTGHGPGTVSASPRGTLTVVEVATTAVPSARFGVDARPGAHDRAAARIAASLGPMLPDGSTLVLGSEEFIALPLAVADRLDRMAEAAATTTTTTTTTTTRTTTTRAPRAAGPRTVRFSTTTRSPIAVIDRPDYAIASAIGFRSHDRTSDGFGARFAYNLTRSGERFDAVVFVPEPDADRTRMLAPDGVAEALRRVTGHVIVVLTNPEEPATP